jgi:hypothetical protein
MSNDTDYFKMWYVIRCEECGKILTDDDHLTFHEKGWYHTCCFHSYLRIEKIKNRKEP